jgi:hypothetical protein
VWLFWLSYIDTNGNDPALLSPLTLELNVDDDFLSKLKGADSACSYYFSGENELRRKSQNIMKSSDELFRYHHRVGIPRPAKALKKILLLKYHDNVEKDADYHVCGYNTN